MQSSLISSFEMIYDFPSSFKPFRYWIHKYKPIYQHNKIIVLFFNQRYYSSLNTPYTLIITLFYKFTMR